MKGLQIIETDGKTTSESKLGTTSQRGKDMLVDP
jgi:hypothetical protein